MLLDFSLLANIEKNAGTLGKRGHPLFMRLPVSPAYPQRLQNLGTKSKMSPLVPKCPQALGTLKAL